MAYYTGSVVAVPNANRDAYIAHAAKAWPYFQRRGAIRLVENWGEDVPPGKVTDFIRAVQAKDDESVVFSWIEWPDKATADRAWGELSTDPQVAAEMGEMPFDGKRMIWGGFTPVMEAGSDRGAGYYQGFLVPVPERNRQAYADMARQAWSEMFQPKGCLGIVEAWGEDMPRGKLTDMYRATDAKDGEAVVFAWTSWPDRATCDAAARAMQDETAGQEMPEMPFDGKRIIFAGFAPVFDSERA